MTGREIPRQPDHLARDIEPLRTLAGEVERGPAPPALVALAGVPGSGKSTLARRLAAGIPAAALNSDEARFALVDRPRYTRAESRRVFDALYAVTGELLRDGRSVVLDATHSLRRDRDPLFALAALAGAALTLVDVTAPEAVILARLRRRRDARDPFDRSEAGERIYRAMAARFEPITEPHLTVESAEPLDAAVERILRAVRQGGIPGRA